LSVVGLWLRHLVAIAVVTLAVVGPVSPWAFASVKHDARPATGLPGFTGCRSFTLRSPIAVVRPRSIMLACGDGNFYVTGLRWSRWDLVEGDGTGVGHQNDCQPNCAAGHFHTYRLALRLYGATKCGRRSVLQFTRVSWRFVGPKPNGVARAGSEPFRCSH
jgi:hypothetical protein